MSVGTTLLRGVSDFWLRHFADVKLIERGHEAVLEAAGASYERMLLSVMRLSLQDCPLTEVAPWQLMILFEDQFRVVPTTDEDTTYWLWELPNDIRDLAYIQNVALDPKAILERDVDFELIANDTARLVELRFYEPTVPTDGWFLLFYKDPFSWTTAGNPVPGFGLSTQVYDLALRVTSAHVEDWTAVVSVDDWLKVSHDDGTTSYGKVSAVAASYAQVSLRTELGSTASGQLTAGVVSPQYDDVVSDPLAVDVETVSTRVRALSGWAPKPEKDYYSLYEMYGHPFSLEKTVSTDSYRALLRGLWNLYVRGPVLPYIEAALGAMSGFPLVRATGELVTSVDTTSRGVVVVTNNYELLEGVLTVIPGTTETYTLPAGTELTAEIIFGAREYYEVPRDGTAYTIFTDTVWLTDTGTPASFAELGCNNTAKVVVGLDEYEIEFLYDSALQIKLADDPGAASSGLSWRIEHTEGAATVVLAEGTAGQFTLNAAVDTPLSAFQTIADAHQVTDYLESPTWWHNTTIPPTLVEGLGAERRRVQTSLFPVRYGYYGYQAYYGDLGMYYGANSDGVTAESLVADPGTPCAVLYDNNVDFLSIIDPQTDNLLIGTTFWNLGTDDAVISRHSIWLLSPNAFTGEASFLVDGRYEELDDVDYDIVGKVTSTCSLRFGEQTHHAVAYLLLDKFLKWNSFEVLINNSTSPYPQDLATIVGTLIEARPAHTYPFVAHEASLWDLVGEVVDDLLEVEVVPVGGGGGVGGAPFGGGEFGG